MKLKSLLSFKATVIEPCSKLLSKFKRLKPSSIKFRPRKRSCRIRKKAVKFKKSLGFTQCRPKSKTKTKRSERTSRTRRIKTTATPAKKPVPKVRVAELMTVLFSLRKAKEIEEEDEGVHPVMADPTSVGKVPFPSPITPLFARTSNASASSKKEESMRNSSASSKKEESSESDSEDIEDVEELFRSFESYLAEMVVEERELKDLKDVEELLYCWKNLKSPIFIDLVCGFYGELCKDLFSHSKEAM